MHPQIPINRRSFLKSSTLAGGALLAARYLPFEGTVQADPLTSQSRVAVTSGSDRTDNIFRGMEQLKKEITAAIGNRTVVIKPNNVSGGTVTLADTPVETIEGILEFLKSIGKTDVIVAESNPTTTSQLAFSRLNYFSLLKKYPVRFKSLNEEGYQKFTVWNWNNSTSAPLTSLRVSKMLLNPKYFVISAPLPKTHDRVIATLSLKCVVMGSVVIDSSTFSGGGGSADKQSMHLASGTRSYGDGTHNTYNNFQDLNDNIFRLSRLLAPSMAVIDFYQGMQNDGPSSGLPVDPQRTAVVSLDFLSADRIAVQLMDLNTGILAASPTDGNTADNSVPGGSPATITYHWPKYPAYLNYCAQFGLGQYNTDYINLVGDVTSLAGLSPLMRTYVLHTDTRNGHMLWMRPTPLGAPLGTDRRLT
jgi:uncharacterized protein (DUF362 family)